MWLLPHKPDLQTALADIGNLIKTCQNLSQDDETKLADLYKAYDAGGGKATDAQLKPLEAKRNTLLNQYKETFNGGRLQYIRTELMEDASKCPYCGINTPSQLDHFMSKSTYGQLAVCRLNLVPSCNTCNRLKGSISHHSFAHPYYQQFPGTAFLKAVCSVRGGTIVASLAIDRAAIADPTLADKLEKQYDCLDLKRRIARETNEFLTRLFAFHESPSDEALRTHLEIELHHTDCLYGRNDWRTALLRGLLDCKALTARAANAFAQSAKPVNGGGA